MPAASAYRRAPLVNPAYVPLSDAALHPEGTMKNRIQQVLNMVSPRHMSTLDSVLATKLGGYAQLPPMPDVEAAAALLPADPSRFVEIVWSASLLAAMSRDKEGMLRVLGAMRAFAQALPQLSEEALFACGADALRLTVDLYRRTGQPFLLNLLETMRGQLPDVSGLMHMFPFQREYRRESQGNTPEEKAFYDRMDRFAMGRGAADALAMTVFLGQYSGSGRDAAAPLTGLNALNRYHGMPCGAFAADPYLAGRDPARAVELDALCAQIEAYAAVGGLPYLDNTDTVFGQVYQGMDVVDAMACVDTVKDDDGNDTYRPTEEAAITINSVTITTYSSAEDNGLDTVG